MNYSKRYSKNLKHLTSVRLSEDLRMLAEHHAEVHGISFSDFVRQSISRNIRVCSGIEEEVNKRTLEIALGK